MFGCKKEIKDRLEKLERKQKCSEGKHEWEMKEAYDFSPITFYGHPNGKYYIGCKYCGERLPEDKYEKIEAPIVIKVPKRYGTKKA